MEEETLFLEFGNHQFREIIREDERELRVLSAVGDDLDDRVIQISKILSDSSFNRVMCLQTKMGVFLKTVEGFNKFQDVFKAEFKRGGCSRAIIATDCYGFLQEVKRDRTLNRFDAVVVNCSDKKTALVDFCLFLVRILKHLRPQFKIILVYSLAQTVSGAGIYPGTRALILDTGGLQEQEEIEAIRRPYSFYDIAYVKLLGNTMGYSNRIDVVLHPPEKCRENANRLLTSLGAVDDEAVDDDFQVSVLGEWMSNLPMELRLSALVFSPEGTYCRTKLIDLVSMLYVFEEWGLSVLPKYITEASDHLALIQLYREIKEKKNWEGWRIRNGLPWELCHTVVRVREYLYRRVRPIGLPQGLIASSMAQVKRCLTSTYVQNVSKLEYDLGYTSLEGSHGSINPNSAASIWRQQYHPPKFVLYHSITDENMMVFVSEIGIKEIKEVLPYVRDEQVKQKLELMAAKLPRAVGRPSIKQI